MITGGRLDMSLGVSGWLLGGPGADFWHPWFFPRLGENGRVFVMVGGISGADCAMVGTVCGEVAPVWRSCRGSKQM